MTAISLYALGLAAFVLSLCLSFLLRKIASPLGLIDISDKQSRKDHSGNPALVGGFAIVCSTLLISAFRFDSYAIENLTPLLIGMTAYSFLGVYDDAQNIPATYKLVLQILIASILVLIYDLWLVNFGHVAGKAFFSLGILQPAFTLFCIIAYINAFNFIDGMDGLGGGIAFISFALFSLIAFGGQLAVIQESMLILASATIGFLILNMRSPFRSKALVFLGDGGSLGLSFAIAWGAITLANAYTDNQALPPPVTYAFILAYPVFDMISVMADRLRRKKSIFDADTNHLHHLLKRRGVDVRLGCPLLLALSAFYAAIGIALWKLHLNQNLSALVWLALLGGHFILYHGLNKKGDSK